jgi:hypothetical protein
MRRPKHITGLILGLWVMSVGGLLLHHRIHPVSKDAFNWFAIGFALFNTVVLPWMFCFRKGTRWAYVINATTVVVGVVGMTAFSINHWDKPLTVMNILLFSTLADSLILLAKLPMAHAILRAWRDFDERGVE